MANIGQRILLRRAQAEQIYRAAGRIIVGGDGVVVDRADDRASCVAHGVHRIGEAGRLDVAAGLIEGINPAEVQRYAVAPGIEEAALRTHHEPHQFTAVVLTTATKIDVEAADVEIAAGRQAGCQQVTGLLGQERIADIQGRVQRAGREGRLAFLQGFGAHPLGFEIGAERIRHFVAADQVGSITRVADLHQAGFTQRGAKAALRIARSERTEIASNRIEHKIAVWLEHEHIAELRGVGGVEDAAAIEGGTRAGGDALAGRCVGTAGGNANVLDAGGEGGVKRPVAARQFAAAIGAGGAGVLHQLEL